MNNTESYPSTYSVSIHAISILYSLVVSNIPGISYPSCLYLSRKYLGLPDGEITHQDVVQHQASKIVISFWMNPTAMARIIDP